MIYLTTLLVLLAGVAIYDGWRIGKLEDQQKEHEDAERELGEFIDDILDTLDVLRAEKAEREKAEHLSD